MDWFTSDTHFGHANIIKYCKRPFETVEDMDRVLVENWNSIVGKEDLVYHLGDFALCKKERAIELGSQLNGTRILIKGNHDRFTNISYYAMGFSKIFCKPFRYQEFILSHKPELGRIGFPINLCGHVHEKWVMKGNSINVGVDQWNFKPINLDIIRGLLNNINYDCNKSE